MVWQDLRQPLLEDVYRHSVQQARLGPVLELLDDALGSLCEATPKELHAGASLCSQLHHKRACLPDPVCLMPT